MGTSLRALLLADLPDGFCGALIELFQHVHSEAFASVKNDPRFEEPEFRYLHGHTRRALAEVGLRKLATRYGLNFEMRRADGFGGPEHVRVTSGRFWFTACYVGSPGTFPKDSEHRRQYSRINEHAAQGQLFAIASTPKQADIYAILAHCEAMGDKSKLGSMCFGFPNDECDDWIEEPLAVVDLADAQENLRRKQDDMRSAEPKWKKPKKNADENEG